MSSLFQYIFNSRPLRCNEEVEIDSPAFAQLDPHLHVDENEDVEQAQLPPHMRSHPRRPPSFDMLLNNIRAITKKTEHIKGFRFEISGAPSNNFHLSHTWNIPYKDGKAAEPQGRMGGMMGMGQKEKEEGSYCCGIQYIGGKLQTYLDQPTIIMTGRMDSSGKLESAIIKKFNDMIQFRFSTQHLNSNPDTTHCALDVDIEGDDYVHTLKMGPGYMSANMMQTIGKNFVLGYDFMHLTERNQQIFNYAAKIHNNRHNFLAQFMAPQSTLLMGYQLRLQKKAFLVSELEINTQEGQTKSVLGYRQRFSSSEIIATLSSKGKISTVLSITGFAYQLKICAMANYLKDTYKFGYGVSMGQIQ